MTRILTIIVNLCGTMPKYAMSKNQLVLHIPVVSSN